MSSHRPRAKASLPKKLTELSLAVPQVVAHRVARMAIAGGSPSARDKNEFKLMVAEKQSAFLQSWSAMAVRAAQANQAIALGIFTLPWLPMRRNASVVAVTSRLQRAAASVLEAGIAPVHRKAVANAKRLARTKLR